MGDCVESLEYLFFLEGYPVIRKGKSK